MLHRYCLGSGQQSGRGSSSGRSRRLRTAPDPHTGYLVLEWKLSRNPHAGDVQVGRSWDTTRTVGREPRLQIGSPSDGDLLADLDGRRVFGRLGKRPVVLDDLGGRQR